MAMASSPWARSRAWNWISKNNSASPCRSAPWARPPYTARWALTTAGASTWPLTPINPKVHPPRRPGGDPRDVEVDGGPPGLGVQLGAGPDPGALIGPRELGDGGDRRSGRSRPGD